MKSDRMKVGVRKLNETNAVVDGLKAELIKLEPVLKEKAIETEALLAQVAKDFWKKLKGKKSHYFFTQK